MPRKQMSEEARKAASERLKAYHAAKKAQKETEVKQAAPAASEEPKPETPEQPSPVPQGGTVMLTQEQFQMMLDRLSARPDAPASPQAVAQAFPGQSPQLNAQGGVVGVIERFPVDPKHYVNPVETLYDIPELSRFAMRTNYVIEWKVTPTKYQTAMGTWYIEPRFELTLKRKQLDDNGEEIVKYDKNGKPFHPRIVLGRSSFFNDPPADIMEAENAGLTLEDVESDQGPEKMRMYRYKFWLVERLLPKPPQFSTNAKKEEVIGGKVYEIDEYSHPL